MGESRGTPWTGCQSIAGQIQIIKVNFNIPKLIHIFFLKQLLLSYNPSFLESKDVMLDDITFENCAEGDIPEGSDQLSCDFEKDTCSWFHDYTASLLWKRSNGVYTDITGNGRHSNKLLVSDCSTICKNSRYQPKKIIFHIN